MRNKTIRRELFRHTRVASPRVLDLGARVQKIPELRKEQSGSLATRRKWARKHLASSDGVRSLSDLDLPVLAATDITGSEEQLPSRDNIADALAYAKALQTWPSALKAASDQITTSLFAAILAGDDTLADELSRSLQVVEALPTLAQTRRGGEFVPIVLTRDTLPAQSTEDTSVDPELAPQPDRAGPGQVLAAWDLGQEYQRWKEEGLQTRADEIKAMRFTFQPPKLDSRMRPETRDRRLTEARRSQWKAFTAEREAARAEVKEGRASMERASPRALASMMRADAEFGAAMSAAYGVDVAAVVDEAPINGGVHKGFCDVYRDAAKAAAQAGRPDQSDCTISIDNPCVEAFMGQRMVIRGGDDVRLVGTAQLITVEEEWMGYHFGEISAVSPVMKGEFHESLTKNTRVLEDVSEDTRIETGETETETSQTTESELTTQVSLEIQSRLSSDISAEASGSGGGTIGVVNFEGSASLGSNLGVGVDTTSSEQTDDRFTQEVVSRAVERTKEVTTKLRRQRSMRTSEDRTIHRIDNTGSAARTFNAVYCFLDKEICIKETVYGLRQFLTADLLRPGLSLLEQEARRQAIDLADRGDLPDFDINPAQITPQNYLSLVGKYRAANIMPPPSAVRMESRTYKTEAANESKAPAKGTIEKVADTLAPFFGEYKRHLIQDQIDIPEGYRVQQVAVTVSHGKNGVSIPAHLPFSIMGAALSAAPNLGAAAIPPTSFYYLPVAIWQILYTASPLMHYNADSSNVTMTIGHQSYDSDYFFFDPEEMLREVLDALGSSTVLRPEVLEDIQKRLLDLYLAFGDPSNDESLQQVLSDLNAATFEEISTFLTDLHGWLGTLVSSFLPNLLSPPDPDDPDEPGMPSLPAIPSIDPSLLQKIPQAIMAPFRIFFEAVMEHLNVLMEDILGDLFAFFENASQNTETKVFGGTAGFTGSLPLSFNCVGLKPGVTVNVTACLVRIEQEALDLWRLETFERLSQAYAQLEAEHAAKTAQGLGGPALRANPTVMRTQEREVLKTRVIGQLHRRYSANSGQPISLDELQLFEAAIDWENMTYRVYGYGPVGAQVSLEALGLYGPADIKRRAFMDAAWGKVMLPLREDPRLEQVFLSFLKSGQVSFEADLLAQLEGTEEERYDALTVLYRDMVLRRNTELGRIVSERSERIPTDIIALYEGTEEAPWPSSGVFCGVVEDR